MEDLIKLRKDIDDIDSELVKLFEKRMETVLKIAEYKEKNNLEILNRPREEEVIKKSLELLNNEAFKGSLEDFLSSLMRISRELQEELLKSSRAAEPLKAGFQGIPGSFSEQALFEYFGNGTEAKPVKNFEDIFLGLKNNEFDYGVLPIENSSTGGISEVYDLLNKYDFSIVGEVCIRVHHNLLGVKGAGLEDIKEVYSHPQAFEQCSEFLGNYPMWRLIPYHNTAQSAEFVSLGNRRAAAAIGSEKAAEIYGLDILQRDINSNGLNTTRFAVLAREMKVNKDCNKVSVVLSTAHRAGYLYAVLRHFAENNINLLKIESRPIKNKPWEYFFYIDFEGNMEDERLKAVMEAVKNNSRYFKLLGNYKSSN